MGFKRWTGDTVFGLAYEQTETNLRERNRVGLSPPCHPPSKSTVITHKHGGSPRIGPDSIHIRFFRAGDKRGGLGRAP